MSEQTEIKGVETSETRVDTFKFDKPNPIKGYPELHWHGKRLFRSTQYYPAQLKETYGEPKDGWINLILWGDNLQVMSHLLKEYRGEIGLIYIDPPYDSKADYKMKVKKRGKEVLNDHMAFEEKQYSDIWTNDSYLQYMYERLILMRELLSEDGSIFVHCDFRKAHFLQAILDEVFGQDNFMNEIIWHYRTYQGQVKEYFPRKHDNILWYKKKNRPPFKLKYQDNFVDTVDYKRWFSCIVDGNKIKGDNYPITDSRFDGYLKAWKESNEGREPTKDDVIMEVRGYVVDDVWTDIQALDPKDLEEKNGYPTQKPESLLERIIESTSNPGDLVFDCFMGSGTTQSVAMKMGRRFIGADINLGAIQITTKRLLNIAKELHETTDGQDYFTGFEVYNVNNYDIFRNPVQAKELLIKALEVQPLPSGSIWDGEKDGKMVKVMPVNRIACKADLEELRFLFGDPSLEKRSAENPTKSVLDIELVCMGHEPGLAVELQKMAHPIKINVDVVDILKGKDLQFKRDSEAHVAVENEELVIKSFYPMNLLGKLSMEKTMIEDWRELVDSIMIDFNYDGAVLNPTVVDVPDKKSIVEGVYPIPADHGHIRIKITDLLSESLELDVEA